MIDVLAFPPSDAVLDRMRAARLARAQRLEARGRVARFVSVGLFLGWVADVGAALAPAPGTSAIVFGVASLLLALLVIGAHLLARGVLAHADRDRRMAHRDFSPVQMDDVEPLLARAAADTVVAQYLRMVGRQRRPLVGLELAALMRWRSAPSAPPPPRDAEVKASPCAMVD